MNTAVTSHKIRACLLLLGLAIGLGACAGAGPSGAIGGGSTVNEPSNTPMPTGHVAPEPMPFEGASEKFPAWHVEVKATVQCREGQSMMGDPYRVRFSGLWKTADGTTVTADHGWAWRVLNQGGMVVSYMDIDVKEGSFEFVLKTEDPLKTSFYSYAIEASSPFPVPPHVLGANGVKNCPGLQCVEGPKYHKWDATITVDKPETVLPCAEAAEAEPLPEAVPAPQANVLP